MEGRIVKVSTEGYGFIISPELPFTRIFFHWTALKQNTLKFPDLKKGMRVSFEPTHSEDRGTRAIKIEVIKREIQEEESEEKNTNEMQ